jgi:hypothetical protein
MVDVKSAEFLPPIFLVLKKVLLNAKKAKKGIFKCELTYINLREYASALSSKLLSKKNDEDDINLKKVFGKIVVAFILYGKFCIFFLPFQKAHLKVKLYLCVKHANI